MAKRIYFETVKKWLIGAGITVGTLIGGLFIYLAFLGVIEITGFSGDQVCAGTIEDPCYAYINLTAKEDIFIIQLVMILGEEILLWNLNQELNLGNCRDLGEMVGEISL